MYIYTHTYIHLHCKRFFVLLKHNMKAFTPETLHLSLYLSKHV